MTCTTTSTTDENGLTTTPTEIGYGCAPVCTECEPPSSQTLTINVEQGETFSQTLNPDSSAPQTVNAVSTDGWAIAEVVGGLAVLNGTAPNVSGTYPQVIIVGNECGQATVVVKVIVAAPLCSAPDNITRDISVNTSSRVVSESIALSSNGQSIATTSLPSGVSANIYGTQLLITGTYSGTLPASYSVTIKSNCGNYTATGTLLACVAMTQIGTSGTNELENGVATNYCVTLNGIGASVLEVTGLPIGLSYVITQPSATTTQICLDGQPVGLPDSGSIVFKLQNSCGILTVTLPYTKKIPVAGACTATAKLSETGAQTFTYGVAGALCYTYTGQALTMINADTPPLGLTMAVSGTDPWTVCLSGTPVLDLGIGNGVAGTVGFELKGDCGTTSHNIPYIIPAQPATPTYCVGVYEYSSTTKVLTVWGAAPSSTVSILNATPSTLALDAFGYGTVTLTPTAVAPQCVEISHPTCALVRKQVEILECP
jgi:hypothetical protein